MWIYFDLYTDNNTSYERKYHKYEYRGRLVEKYKYLLLKKYYIEIEKYNEKTGRYGLFCKKKIDIYDKNIIIIKRNINPLRSCGDKVNLKYIIEEGSIELFNHEFIYICNNIIKDNICEFNKKSQWKERVYKENILK